MSAVLDAWLRAQPGRCADCGFHVARQGHRPSCAPTAPADQKAADYAYFKVALVEAAVDGVVHQSKVRPLVRGVIAPKQIGLAYARAIREGLLVERAPERSDDDLGKNRGRWEPTYELRSAA